MNGKSVGVVVMVGNDAETFWLERVTNEQV